MSTIAARFSATPRSTKLSLSGLAVGVLGLVVQWIADPAEFPGFPPGIVFIAVCAALVVAASGRWWAPVFSVLISLWILLGGLAAGMLTANLLSGDAGTVAGNVVMSLGLAVAAVAGVVAMLAARRARA
ncbi:hypothetical protein [Pseudonocardia cypriaca]|uniref:SPW repeat-containing protein n=1 Tax=Pseudonocardia cypriaca TaxID=882449 RepID=A0A543GAX0_9PSEU|nr:hypothetical protein [Pseudonocardia cypriaca]TQM43231.1 hypothetical protein FB388_0573 [Pseudonocardia cypriaca]